MTNEQDLPDDEPLEMVAVAGPAEAQMIEEMLKNNGIDCSLQGDVVSTTWPTVSDLDEARARAAAPSPKLYERMAPAERLATLKRVQTTLDSLRRGGVDRIYPQFALDMAKYPREGVAHRNILVVLCKFPAEGGAPAAAPSGQFGRLTAAAFHVTWTECE